MLIKTLKPFRGKHCETTATGTLLNHLGISLSEPMLFGLGEGLHYIFWKMKGMEIPFIGGRVKPDMLTEKLCSNLGLQLEVNETRSRTKAWSVVREKIDAGIPVGLKLDAYFLDYFRIKFHFAGHYVALAGYDDQKAFLIDTAQQGYQVSTKLSSLADARDARGPMSSPNRSYTIAGKFRPEQLPEIITEAIRRNAANYLAAPISNIAHRGIEKTAVEIRKWYESSENPAEEFSRQAMMMEKAGTGGSLFRNFYRDFLKESYEITGNRTIQKAHEAFYTIASDWKRVADLFSELAQFGNESCISEAQKILRSLAHREKETFEMLRRI